MLFDVITVVVALFVGSGLLIDRRSRWVLKQRCQLLDFVHSDMSLFEDRLKWYKEEIPGHKQWLWSLWPSEDHFIKGRYAPDYWRWRVMGVEKGIQKHLSGRNK